MAVMESYAALKPTAGRLLRHQEVAEALEAAICRGELAPGAQLRQDHLAQQFSVSHIPVREALRQLVAQGLAVNRPNKGVFVATMSVDEARELTELRVLLEGRALGMALPVLTATDCDAAAMVLEKLDRAEGVDDLLCFHAQFHGCLYTPSDRPRTLAMIEELRTSFERYFRYIWTHTGYRQEQAGEHWTLLQFCREGARDAALDLLARHIRRTGDVICDALPEFPEKP